MQFERFLQGIDRRRYLAEQAARGAKIVGVLPGDLPWPILSALDLQVCELWTPSESRPEFTSPLLPAYLCSVVQHIHRFLKAPDFPLAALVVSNLCDSIKMLGSLVGDLERLAIPLLYYDASQAGWTGRQEPPATHLGSGATSGPLPVVERYRALELDLFIQACEQLAGRSLEPARLERALEQQTEAERLGRELYRRRASGVFGERMALELLRSREWLIPEEHLGLLREALARLEPAAARSGGTRSRIPILLSGIVPEPMTLLDAIEEAGFCVVGDDLLCLGRRWQPQTGGLSSPIEISGRGEPRAHLLRRLQHLPPAPTRAVHRLERAAWVLAEVHRTGARGVLAIIPKFCEPELFGLAALRAGLERARIPLLVLEHEVGVAVGGAFVTRLEAFAEMLVREA